MALSNQCSIYLKFGSKKIKIPVNPKEIEMEYPTDHETYDVLGIGEIVEAVFTIGILGMLFP